MIFKGRYSQTMWGSPLAPFVEAKVRATDDRWVKVFFLIDLGADGTYLPHSYVTKLGLQPDEAQTEDDVTGVGGQKIEHIPYTTQLRFSNNDRRTFDLEIGVFTKAEALTFVIIADSDGVILKRVAQPRLSELAEQVPDSNPPTLEEIADEVHTYRQEKRKVLLTQTGSCGKLD